MTQLLEIKKIYQNLGDFCNIQNKILPLHLQHIYSAFQKRVFFCLFILYFKLFCICVIHFKAEFSGCWYKFIFTHIRKHIFLLDTYSLLTYHIEGEA